MAAIGPGRVMEAMLSGALLSHKNWRIRAGLFTLYAHQAVQFGGHAFVMQDPGVLGRAIDALNEADPELRRAGVEALAALATQVGPQRVLALLAKRDVRPAHVAAVQARYRELSGGGGGAGPQLSSSTTLPEDHAPAPAATAAAAAAASQQMARRRPASSEQPSRSGVVETRVGGGGDGEFMAAQSPQLPAVPGPGRPALASAGAFSGPGRPGSQPTAASAHSASSGSSSGPGLVPGPGPRPLQPAAVSFGAPAAVGAYDAVLEFVVQSADPQAVAADECVQSLCCVNSSAVWQPGVRGSLAEDAGKVKPLPVSSPKELSRVFDDVAVVCANSNSEWKARSAALDRLRGVIAGGAVSDVDGFAALVPRLRDPLVCQLQDLRSSIVR